MPGGAVFLSYASEDAAAAERIATALRAAGIEVWFDKSELRGGDAWDRRIREQIHDCRLFIAVISAHTEARDEGYFRREWKLAVDRTHDMAEKKAFIVPVVIDGTVERGASVPEKFRELQWTRLPKGEVAREFVARIKRLLSPEPPTSVRLPADAASDLSPIYRSTNQPPLLRGALLVAVVVLAVAALAYLIINKPWIPKPATSPTKFNATSSPAPPAVFNPPPHSIAVLPFLNMSGDKDQDYFSDGLSEELLNDLARINDLQVAARTSAFSFKGKDTDVGTIARKLNVGAVLEGSVRRSGHTVRISAQLINAVTGFHLWSKSYDRDLGDVLKLQTEIATAVVGALKVTLLGDIAQKIELGGTRNPAAFDAYLRASKAMQSGGDTAKDAPVAIAAYTEAIRLDPNYAPAFAGRSYALTTYTDEVATGPEIREDFEKAESDARRAVALAPELAEAHSALGYFFQVGALDFARASEEFERAVALAPGNAQALRLSGEFAALMGHFDTALAALRRAVVLDPLGRASHAGLGRAFYAARRYGEAVTAFAEAISLNPNYKATYAYRGFAFYGLGDFESARASCENKRDYWGNQWCLAVVYEKLGRHADAEAELAKLKVTDEDIVAYQYATSYAQWGDRTKALEWLDTAMPLRDPGLINLKTDPLLDPLRKEPRFQAIERALKFPD